MTGAVPGGDSLPRAWSLPWCLAPASPRHPCDWNRSPTRGHDLLECPDNHVVMPSPRRVGVCTATVDDAPALATIYRDASLSNAGDHDVLLAHPAALEFDPTPIALGAIRVAVDDDQVVGFATTLRTSTPREAELVDLFVAPAAMRRGIATLLIKDAQDVARSLGCEFLAVTANPHATAFYAAAGFRGGEVVQTEFGAGKRLILQV